MQTGKKNPITLLILTLLFLFAIVLLFVIGRILYLHDRTASTLLFAVIFAVLLEVIAVIYRRALHSTVAALWYEMKSAPTKEEKKE